MYILDTNVLSELRRPERAHRGVVRWAGSMIADDLFVSVISIWEIEQGILMKARSDVQQAAVFQAWFEKQVLATYAERVLPVALDVARACAALHVPQPRPYRDSLIGATAIARGMTVVTRNTDDFEPMGVRVLNPWDFS